MYSTGIENLERHRDDILSAFANYSSFFPSSFLAAVVA